MSSLFGSRPNYAQVQSPYQEAAGVYPGLPGLTTGAGNYTGSLLAGLLPSSVSQGIKNQGAAWGLTSGAGEAQGNNSLTGNFTLQDLGVNQLNAEQQGFGDYTSFLGSLGQQMLSPQTEMAIAEGEAQPNPTTAGITNMGTNILGMLF
jgi:hypothetical protein